jgi:oligoendopeptidase F
MRDFMPKPAQKPDLGNLPEWNLDDLYPGPDSARFVDDLKACETQAAAFRQQWSGKLADLDGPRLCKAVKQYEALGDKAGRIGSYSQLYYVGDTTDPERGKFFGDVQARLTAMSANLLFFELEMNRIDDDVLASALKHEGLARYKPWLDDLRKERPHQLDDRIEELFLEKSLTASGAWNRLFDETMAALTFDVDGQELALEPTLNLMTGHDGAKRKAAAQALSKTLKDNEALFTRITNTMAKDKEISDRWHKFDDVADARHLANRVEAPVVDALVNAVRNAYPKLSHRYYAMKAKWLGMDQLSHWDRNAPLPDEDTTEVKWEDAKATVLGAYGDFAPEMADIARDFFDKNWIDAPVRKGKASGAFAHPTVPSAHPYVLLNYLGKSRDVMTLAHELGHGVHQVLAADQGALMASTPLTLAETASVFGEMLTFQKLLEQTKDAKTRKIMLASKVEDMLNTVVRQISFYCFEREVHEQRRKGELTAEQLGKLWLDISAESLGPAIKMEDGYEIFWAYIPHFIHSPFYVYAYAFGDCLVNSLYARYQQGDDNFTRKYFDLLKAGGSKHHSELLKPFNLDASDPAFWQMGLSMIEKMIDEIEALDGQ